MSDTPKGIDVTSMTTPGLHAALDERRKQAEDIVTGLRAKCTGDQDWKQVAATDDVTRIKALHGDAQIIQAEINRRMELDGVMGDFEKAAKAATKVATMPMPGAADDTKAAGFGPLTPGQAFVMSDVYRKHHEAGNFRKSVNAGDYGMFPQFGVELPFSMSFPVHRRLLVQAAKHYPEFFAKGTAINEGASSGGGFILPDFDLSPEQLARQSLDLLSLLRVQPTDSNVITWLRQDTRITGATTVGEYTDTDDTATNKPEGGATWSQQTSNVQTIAVHVAVTNQQLDDAPEIRTVIDEDLRFEIEEELNTQCLTGDGTGNNLTGIVTAVGNTLAFTGAGVSHDNMLDAILDGWVYIKLDNEPDPTGVLVYTTDWQKMRTRKTTGTGEYIMGPPSDKGPMTLWSLPLLPTNNITAHTALIGNYQQARLHLRERSMVRLGYAMNDFLANRVRLLAELRACLTVRRPNAFCTVTGLDA